MAECHNQESFSAFDDYQHVTSFPLEGHHGDSRCLSCHARDDGHAVELLAAPTAAPRPQQRTCVDCHGAPHAHNFLSSIAAELALASGESCAKCHPLAHPDFASASLEFGAGRHAHTGFALIAPHSGLNCEACHRPGASFAERYPGRGADDCQACHDDPHQGQFANSMLAAPGCLACHERQQFAPHNFDRGRHGLTNLPLAGAHATLDCERCHTQPSAGAARIFVGTPQRCEQCHSDAHRGFFAPFGSELGAQPSGTCAACHDQKHVRVGRSVRLRPRTLDRLRLARCPRSERLR